MSKDLYELVKSGEYFKEAREWYKTKYVHPFSQRTFLMIVIVIMVVVFGSVLLNIYNLFPTKKEISYTINLADATNRAARIDEVDYDSHDAQLSIVNKLAERYVIRRESYDYDDLKRQFVYIKNSSTRLVFKRFYNFMNIDNPESPVLRYKKNIDRKIKILSAKYPDGNSAIITFRATAEDLRGEKHEDKVWKSTFKFDVDKVSESLPPGQRFNFTVTEYDAILVEDKLKNSTKL